MDWKCFRSSQIPGLIFLIFLQVVVVSAAKKNENVVTNYDREIIKVSGSIDSIKAELERGRTHLSGLKKEEGNYLAQVEQLEKNISSSKTYLKLVSTQIDSTEVQIIALSDSLKLAETLLSKHQKVMKKRLRLAYIAGKPSLLQIIVTAKNVNDAVHRATYMKAVNRYDRALIATIDTVRQAVYLHKVGVEERQQQLQKLLSEKVAEQDQLLVEEASRKKMLDKVRTEKTAYQQMITELESSQKALTAMIRMLEKKKKKAQKDQELKATVAFEKRKGKLAWPVHGPIVGKYGTITHPVYKTVIMNNGVDIKAGKGEPVQSVAPGQVLHTGWMRGLGKLVIIDHSGGYITVYAHLDEIEVDPEQSVEMGETIGRVGDTGAMGTAQLHFEIRKTAETLDPADWLVKQ